MGDNVTLYFSEAEEISNPDILLISLYSIIIISSFVGNSLVLIVILRQPPLKSTTNVYLISLAISDLLVTLVSMPLAAGKAWSSNWVTHDLTGEVTCTLTHYLSGVGVGASAFSIAASAVNKFLAIKYPWRNQKKKYAIIAVISIWIVSLVTFCPILAVRRLDSNPDGSPICIEEWRSDIIRKLVGIFYFLAIYAIPGSIVIISYTRMGIELISKDLLPRKDCSIEEGSNSRAPSNELDYDSTPSVSTIKKSSFQVSSSQGLLKQRRWVAKVLLLIALVFAFCWLPHSIMSLHLELTTGSPPPGSSKTPFLSYALFIGHLNSMLNPFLYSLLSANFRRCLVRLLCHPSKALNTPNEGYQMRINFKDPSKSDPGSSRGSKFMQVVSPKGPKRSRAMRKIKRRKNGQDPDECWVNEFLSISNQGPESSVLGIPTTIREESSIVNSRV